MDPPPTYAPSDTKHPAPPTLPPRPSSPRPPSPDDAHSLPADPDPAADLPAATHPTVVLAIPFPAALRPNDKTPPFVLYAPLAAPLAKPPPGAKEGVTHKAQRKWQEEERHARESGSGFKAKAVTLISRGMSTTKNSRIEFLVRTPTKKKLSELRIIYPASYPAADIKERFTDLIKKAKAGAIRNGIVSTALLPFVLAFDVLTFITGPFEINAVWAASSWTGAARASAISSRVTSATLPVHLAPDARLDALAHRLHEICWRKARPRTVATPRWAGAGPVRRGPDLAGVVLEVLAAYGEEGAGLEGDRRLVAEDLERCLKKGAKEWLKVVS